MTTQTAATPFKLHLSVSPLRVGARVFVLTALFAMLVVGFLGGLSSPAGDATSQVAASTARCGAGAC